MSVAAGGIGISLGAESDPLLKHVPGCPFASDYVVPIKEVKTVGDVQRWENSEAYQ
ncbi:Serine/threonine-protein phosphatase 2A activator, partial [Caligus rogercresseyi]